MNGLIGICAPSPDGQDLAPLQGLQTGSLGAMFGHLSSGLCCFRSNITKQTCSLATALQVLDLLAPIRFDSHIRVNWWAICLVPMV